ncbi:substrate-binding domain-containing protein [Cohnella sp. 56]|uniref:substrate-binding domain-containing protein n=1 Tax=Cohnella sp. 56 TaxID=3113722 RepID=UPI0030E84118
MAKKVTMQSIADELLLSKSLVSKALSNQPGVSEDTRERVRLTAMKLGYPINSSILSVPSAKTGNIAVLLPREDLKDFEYWGKILHGIEKELSEKQLSMIVGGLDASLPTNEGMPSCIADRRVDGALILGLVPLGYILAIKASGIPIVLVDSQNYQLKLDHVFAENYIGGYEATRFLLEKKHRKIGFLGDVQYSASFTERFRGFTAAIQDYRADNRTEIEEFHLTASKRENFFPYSIRQLEEILEKGQRPTALFCGNDPVAFDVLQQLEKRGMASPIDISLIGFDNVQKCEWTTPKLTSVDACKETMGVRAVQLLLRRMENPDERSEHVRITTDIIERNSVLGLI